ncbi:MAG: hypothetical protein LBF39_03560 [Prevotellaceae bacterium]|nr:hypothetical protein [Prevotellaceae bacterium]
MKTKFFRNNCQRSTRNDQRQTVLSPERHLSGRTAALSRVAHLSCLLLLLTATFCAGAQNGVTVTNLMVDAGTVTFNVSWNNDMPENFLWSDTVWVFVDYNDAGTMKRLPLLPGATLIATSAPDVGKVIEENDKGVWVVGNARSAGSFSATIQLFTTTAAADFSGACAYASNYPPVGEYTAANKIKFTGTPEYDIVLKHSNGTTDTLQSGKTFLVPASYTLQSFSYKTGAPGIIITKCHELGVTDITFAKFNPCAGAPYGSTYTLTDDRDDIQYKVIYMPDGRYWMAQDLKFGDRCSQKTSISNSTSLGNVNSSGTYYGDCRTNLAQGAGYYYNRPAIMNSPNALDSDKKVSINGIISNSDREALQICQGICPLGSHVPTIDEWANLGTKMTANSLCANLDCWRGSSWLNFIRQGEVSGTTPSYTSEANYWSSTAGRVLMNYAWITTGNYGVAFSYYGLPLRCVVNYIME